MGGWNAGCEIRETEWIADGLDFDFDRLFRFGCLIIISTLRVHLNEISFNMPNNCLFSTWRSPG